MWLDIPIRMDASVVQETPGPLAPGKLIHINDRIHIGDTWVLATLTATEWTQIDKSV